jgi:hypothetical protein
MSGRLAAYEEMQLRLSHVVRTEGHLTLTVPTVQACRPCLFLPSPEGCGD